MNKFGDLIRSKREEKELLLRHLSAELDIDTAQLSKIERGEKIAKRDLVNQLATILDLNLKLLNALWLADQVFSLWSADEQALEALKIVEEELKSISNGR